MASIRKQGKSWQAIIRRKGHKTLSQFFPKKALAEAWARKKEEEVSQRLHFNNLASEMTVEALMKKYEEEITPRKRGADVEKYRIATVKEHLGSHTLADLSPQHVIEFVDDRLDDVCADSIKKELNVLSHAIDAAMALWKIELPANPVHTARGVLKLTKSLSKGIARERRPSTDELTALYALLPTHFPAEFAVETGMRRGEICAAKRKDRDGTILRIPETKTGVPRTIPLSPRACEILDALPVRDEETVKDEQTFYDYVPSSISHMFNRACHQLEIKDLRFHDLRHEAASRFIERGLSIPEVAKITGQSFTTLQRYTHLKAEDIARKLGNGVSGPQNTSNAR